jgi:ankyrin repeat protein
MSEIEEEFVISARYGEVDEVREALKGGVNVNCKNSFGNTALHCAAANNHTDVVMLLLESGGDIDAQNDSGNTPLAWAASVKARDAVELLVAHGASLNTLNKSGQTALDLAYQNGGDDNPIRDFLLSKFAEVGSRTKEKLTAQTDAPPEDFKGSDVAFKGDAAAPAAANVSMEDQTTSSLDAQD